MFGHKTVRAPPESAPKRTEAFGSKLVFQVVLRSRDDAKVWMNERARGSETPTDVNSCHHW